MMQDQPDVSVVIATRDRPELLRSALQAIFAQDCEETIEAIVVFDQSEPDSGLASAFPGENLTILKNDRVPGLAGARNTGTLASGAEWVAFCDDDDEWLPNKLSKQLALAASEEGADFVVGGLMIDNGDELMPRPHAGARITRLDLLRSRVAEAHPSTFLMRREPFLERIGLLDEELFGSHATDYDLLLRYSADRDVLAVTEPVVRVRMHPISYFGSKWEMKIPALDRMLDKYPDFSSIPEGLARIRGQRAFAMAAAGRRNEALKESWQVLRLNWREKRALLAIAVSLSLVDPNKVLKLAYKRGRGI